MQNFNAQAQVQPTIQRESFLFIECAKRTEFAEIEKTVKVLINPGDIKDIGIGTFVSQEVQKLFTLGYDVKNVYVGSLL